MFFFNDTATTEIYTYCHTLSLHDALPISSKPKVLMTHGFLAHVRCFAFIAPFLAEDYDVVAFDLAGMGDSDMRGRADLLARGGEFREIAEALNMFADGQKPTIIAHSFGSGAALTAVTQWPEAFAGVVVCDLMIMRPALLEEYWKDRQSTRLNSSH